MTPRAVPTTTADAASVIAASMSEGALLAHVRRAARSLGWLTYHTHRSEHSEAGFPDLVLCHPRRGQLVFAELKVEHEKRGALTTAQEKWLDALEVVHGDVYVWRPSDWLSGRIESVLGGGPEATAPAVNARRLT